VPATHNNKKLGVVVVVHVLSRRCDGRRLMGDDDDDA